MTRPEIPDRNPVGDVISGVIFKPETEDKYFLCNTPLSGTEIILNDSFIVRYGIRYIGKPHISIVLGLLVLDYGTMLTGEEAFYYALKKGDRYPRADVIGYRNDGQDEMIVMKKLDTALPLEVLVYCKQTDTKPLAAIEAIIASDREAENSSIPNRVFEYLPRYPTLDDWKAHQND